MKLDIKNGEIRQIIIGNLILPFKKKIKLSEAEKIEGAVSFLEEYIDFSNLGTETVTEKGKDEEFEWTENELQSFLNHTYSGKQKIFLKSLAKNPGRLSWLDLKEIMNEEGEELKPFSMAGILSCFARRSQHFGKKEDFWESIWDEGTEERFYRLKEKYRKIFAKYYEAK